MPIRVCAVNQEACRFARNLMGATVADETVESEPGLVKNPAGHQICPDEIPI
jgi:hypothetical protein